MNRRAFLRRSVGTGLATGVAVGTAPSSVTAEPNGSITFSGQTSPDGQTLSIDAIEVDQDAGLGLRNQSDDEGIYWAPIEAGTYEDYEVIVNPPITERSEVSVSLYPDGGGSSYARETATVDVPDDIATVDGVDRTLIEPDPEAGFEYPFYIYAPQQVTTGDGDAAPVLVEPANSGETTDDMEVHRSAGERLVEGGLPREIADELGSPLVVPVFPRPESDPVDWTHYVHALDDTTMGIEDGPLERVDLQLLRMVERAHEFLDGEGYPVRTDGILLNGFSASGNFVDRFAVLHPDEVISVTAGGLNGMPLLPLDEFEGRELPFHVGTADVEALTGDPVDRGALDETNQFLYMGAEDENDTVGYDDAWTDDSLEQLALEVYGDDMISERFPTSQRAYEEAGVSAQFRVYPDAGHTPAPALRDIVEFHRQSVGGKDVSAFGDDIGTALRVDVSPDDPVSDSEVTFDAGESTVTAGSEILSYQWAFGDDEVGTGETFTHAYAEPGEYTVTLTATTDRGRQYEEAIEVRIGDADATADSDEDETDSEDATEANGSENATEANEPSGDGSSDGDGGDGDDASDGDSDTSDDSAPGFGIGGALAGIGGAGYLLRRRLSDEATEST